MLASYMSDPLLAINYYSAIESKKIGKTLEYVLNDSNHF